MAEETLNDVFPHMELMEFRGIRIMSEILRFFRVAYSALSEEDSGFMRSEAIMAVGAVGTFGLFRMVEIL